MEITYLGMMLIPLGLIWVVFSERWLYRVSVFFIPFTASALINWPGGFWLSPVQYFGSLWLLRYAVANFGWTGKMRLSFWLMSAFFAIVVVSSAMPVFIDGDLFIRGTFALEAAGPLHFSSRNITTPMYVLFGLLFAAFVSMRNANLAALEDTLRVYVASAFFVAIWGLFQFVCNVTGAEYPDFIFNNSANAVAQGYTQIYLDLSDASLRVSSVAVEPSVMAQFLISALPIVVLARLIKQPVLPKFLDSVAIVTIVAVLVVSTSSSAYLGLVLCAVATLIVLLYMRRTGVRIWLFCLTGIVAAVVGYTSIPLVQDAVEAFLVYKLSSGSGIERLLTIEYAWSYFLAYPILGIGWGSATSNDLIVNLLVNTGILGFVTFAVLIGYVLFRLASAVVRSRRTHAWRETTLAEGRLLGILASFLPTLALQAASGFQYGYAYFWMALGLAIAAPLTVRGVASQERVNSISRLRVAAQ